MSDREYLRRAFIDFRMLCNVVNLTGDARYDVHAVMGVIEQLQERAQAADADTRRLDWLEAHDASVGHYRETNRWWSRAGSKFLTARDAIDAAMLRPAGAP